MVKHMDLKFNVNIFNTKFNLNSNIILVFIQVHIVLLKNILI